METKKIFLFYCFLIPLLRFFYVSFLFFLVFFKEFLHFCTISSHTEGDAQVPKSTEEACCVCVLYFFSCDIGANEGKEEKRWKTSWLNLERELEWCSGSRKNMIPKEFPSYFRSRFSFSKKHFQNIHRAENSSTLKTYARKRLLFSGFHSSLEASWAFFMLFKCTHNFSSSFSSKTHWIFPSQLHW